MPRCLAPIFGLRLGGPATDVARVIGQPIPLWLDGTRLPDYLVQTHHHLGEPILVPYLAARSIPLRLSLNVETSLPDGKLDIDVKVTELAALCVCVACVVAALDPEPT